MSASRFIAGTVTLGEKKNRPTTPTTRRAGADTLSRPRDAQRLFNVSQLLAVRRFLTTGREHTYFRKCVCMQCQMVRLARLYVCVYIYINGSHDVSCWDDWLLTHPVDCFSRCNSACCCCRYRCYSFLKIGMIACLSVSFTRSMLFLDVFACGTWNYERYIIFINFIRRCVWFLIFFLRFLYYIWYVSLIHFLNSNW